MACPQRKLSVSKTLVENKPHRVEIRPQIPEKGDLPIHDHFPAKPQHHRSQKKTVYEFHRQDGSPTFLFAHDQVIHLISARREVLKLDRIAGCQSCWE
jgi:hypothetical protein